MNKNVWIILAVVVILGLGAWMFLAKKPATNTNTTNSTGGNTASCIEGSEVTYTNSGFSPSCIKIKLGTTVTFRNQSSQAVQPASDPHPVHTGLPGFDSRQGVASGTTYQFTFTGAGTFGYHNHLNASETGAVVVE